jgi:hypothetical protein
MIRNVPILQMTFSRHVHRLIALCLRPFCGISLRLEVQNFLTVNHDGVVSGPRMGVRSQRSVLNIGCSHKDLLIAW